LILAGFLQGRRAIKVFSVLIKVFRFDPVTSLGGFSG
jgi:hypothetical protein